MFIAHYGAAFGAKLATPKTSLGSLILASLFIDLLWPTFLLLRIEDVRIAPGITVVSPFDFSRFPYSHSLLAVLFWSGLMYTVYHLQTGNRRGAAIVGALAASHWFLDAIVHRPDLPLYPGGTERIGLGLWDSPAGTLAAELAIFGAGLFFYARRTRAADRTGTLALLALVVLLLLIYSGSLFGPPPPSTAAVAWTGELQWLFVFWAYWLDRHRSLKN